jgi:hypothetical protein
MASVATPWGAKKFDAEIQTLALARFITLSCLKTPANKGVWLHQS